MVRLQIEGTKKSPSVDLNPETGEATFIGRSIHSDAFVFYEEIIEWFTRNINNFETFTVNLGFDHINTVTNKCLLQILLIIVKAKESGKDIKVIWSYDAEDDDMLETGEELELLSQIDFKYIKM